MKAVSGIYKLTCIVTGESYIGKTVGRIDRRVMIHLNGYTPGCRKLHASIKYYGKENFTWEILHENVIPELLPLYEQQEIKIHKTKAPHGFNLTDGGETGHHSEETIRKRTETLRANPPMLGKKHTPEAKAKMSESRTGSKRTLETRQKMSESAMGHSVSEETKQKIGNANRGHKWNDEARQAQSEHNSGKGNPMYGRKRKRGENASNASPYRKPAREFFHSLPPSMHLKEKREHLYAKFPDVKRYLIERWTLIWIRDPYLPSGEVNPLYDSHYDPSNTQSMPEKSFAREYFFSLPSDMNLKDKRQRLYDAFPTVKNATLGEWIRNWTNYKPYKEGSRRSAEYHQTHEMFLSLPSDMSVVEKRQYLQANVDGVTRHQISRWVKQWTGTVGKQPTHPDYERAHAYFLSLPSDMPLNKKFRLFRENFPNVSKASVNKWIKKWTGETMPTGAPSHPHRPQIHDYFLSLPLNMPISEKRKRILEKFGDVVSRSLVNRWTHRWHIEITGSPPPDQRWSREPFNHWKKGKPAHIEDRNTMMHEIFSFHSQR